VVSPPPPADDELALDAALDEALDEELLDPQAAAPTISASATRLAPSHLNPLCM